MIGIALPEECMKIPAIMFVGLCLSLIFVAIVAYGILSLKAICY